MADRRTLLALLLFSLCGTQKILAAPEANTACSQTRERISEQIKEARLMDDTNQRVALEARLHGLAERCRGVVAVQSNHDEIERATHLATIREAQLREALSTGDPQVIEISKRRLDQARRALEAAKR
ncbi:hypothetical protein CH92_19635 [Stutzerimonas stutzeri]|uniref:DUF1090 domain-containing protein n=1 Tax=Stutzerimonas stutzeri TaxID=316 RepID=W8R436_STUST|nr:DUF1090 family protein [Stutzerimonas stutzeri]AHL77695.1 hypothetical protein CH92_19635 [Stutzerimonas stutzeri]MCQ4330056.1 DUF1090 domain-containing protein [Stutzerimonas stutzeri]